ncbi:MAG: type II toxin-antitoxin system PemK/MazF family toxin [Clostridia bacterium]|jgi:mRNA interferase MazF|nr:type II toxin-antitoxin system PemK/MazF family toxin [Clostridia bacterium]
MIRLSRSKTVIKRGDLFSLRLGTGHEDGLDYYRPVLVIQNDIGNRYCNSVIVVPLSYKLRGKHLFFGVLINSTPETGLVQDAVALLSQIRTVEKSYFSNDNYIGKVDRPTMEKVDECLALSVGLSTLQKLQNRNELYRESS